MLDGVSILPDVPAVEEEIYEALFKEESDPNKYAITIETLELICHTILDILERQCEDQLPGGKYWSPCLEDITKFSNVPSTNMIGERKFAVLDRLVCQKPSAKTVSLEALIMWSHVEKKQVNDRQMLIDTVQQDRGVWQTKERVQEEYDKIKNESEKCHRAIYHQLQYHQKILQVEMKRKICLNCPARSKEKGSHFQER